MSDVDLAVEIVQKETDADRARSKNYDRVEELAASGHEFRNVVEMAACWHVEVFDFLKGRSRVIALADTRRKRASSWPYRIDFYLESPRIWRRKLRRARERARLAGGIRTIVHFEK